MLSPKARTCSSISGSFVCLTCASSTFAYRNTTVKTQACRGHNQQARCLSGALNKKDGELDEDFALKARQRLERGPMVPSSGDPACSITHLTTPSRMSDSPRPS